MGTAGRIGRMSFPRRPIVLAVAVLLFGLRAAAADDPKPAEKAPKAAKAAAAKTEAIAWRPVWIDAVEEAAERNILLFLHSHAST